MNTTQENNSLEALIEDHFQWAEKQFDQATPHSITKHLVKEANELADEPGNELEIADIFLLLTQLARKQKINLALAVRTKIAINKSRKWGKPDADGVVEHIEPPAGPPISTFESFVKP